MSLAENQNSYQEKINKLLKVNELLLNRIDALEQERSNLALQNASGSDLSKHLKLNNALKLENRKLKNQLINFEKDKLNQNETEKVPITYHKHMNT